MESNNSHRVIANKLSCLIGHHLSANRSVITWCSISLCRRVIAMPCFGHDAVVNYVPGLRLWQQIHKIKIKLFYFLSQYPLLSPTHFLCISKIRAKRSFFLPEKLLSIRLSRPAWRSRRVEEPENGIIFCPEAEMSPFISIFRQSFGPT